jgi:hypothetical protein
MPRSEPPTGIIRTLPAIYANPAHLACKNYRACLDLMATDPDVVWFMALAKKPKLDFLHVYVLIAGRIEARFNFAGYRQGGKSRLWDGIERTPEAFAICAGPISRPPSPIHYTGFRGFRYTSDLW